MNDANLCTSISYICKPHQYFSYVNYNFYLTLKTIICHSLSDKYSLTICETMGNIMTVTLYTKCNENFLVFDNCLKKKTRTTLFLLKDRLTDKLLTDFCWHMPLLFIFWYFIFHLIYPFIYMLLKCHMWYKIAVWFHFIFC